MNTTPYEDAMTDAHEAAKEFIRANDTLRTLNRVGAATEVDSLRVKRAKERLDDAQKAAKRNKNTRK